MTLSERARSSLFAALSEVADEEAVEEMLAHFPARDTEEAASKEFIRAEIAELRTEMVGIRSELKDDIGGLRAELKGDIAGLRTELKGDIGRLETALERGLRLQTGAMVGTVAATLGIVTAANALF